MQILTGGVLKAMPHAVLCPSNTNNICRNSFAVFMEPNFDEVLNVPEGRQYE